MSQRLRVLICRLIGHATGLSTEAAEAAYNSAVADREKFLSTYVPGESLRQEGKIEENSNVEFFYGAACGYKPEWLIVGPKSNGMEGTYLLDPQVVEKIENEDYYWEMFSEY